MQEVKDVEDLLETEDDAPIIRMINALLTQAARDGASDIHIEAFETYSLVRFRIDGTLRDIVRPKRALHAALVSRIKIMAALDIAESACHRTAASHCASAAGRSMCASRRCRPARRARRVALA